MRGILRMIPASYGGSYNPLTAAWITATGESDVTILNGLNTFEAGLISNNFISRLPIVYPIVGGTSAKHSLNFMNTATYQITFQGGFVHNSNGWTGNGTNAIANTGANAITVTPRDNNSYGFYSRTNSVQAASDISAADTSFHGNEILTKFPDNNTYWPNSEYVLTGNGNLLTTTLGLISNVRTTANEKKLYQGSTLKSTSATSTVINNNAIYYLSARGYDGVYPSAYFSSRNLSFIYFANISFSDAEITIFNNLVQALQTSLSRQV